MGYKFTVAAVLASVVHWGGNTEFDKAAEVRVHPHWPGSESCGPASSVQICAWAQFAAPLSSEHDPHKWASRSVLCRSSHPQPVRREQNYCVVRQEVNYVTLTTLSWTDPLGVFVPLKTHKSKASGLSIFINHDTDAHGRTLSNEEKVMVMCKSIENNSV